MVYKFPNPNSVLNSNAIVLNNLGGYSLTMETTLTIGAFFTKDITKKIDFQPISLFQAQYLKLTFTPNEQGMTDFMVEQSLNNADPFFLEFDKFSY